MNERSKLLKKAVLTGVGATDGTERIKQALKEAMDDLVKVGQDLFEDLESKGKNRTGEIQTFLKNLQEEATRRTGKIEKEISSKVQTSIKKAAKECGLAMHEDLEEIIDRLDALEDALIGQGTTEKKPRSTRSRHH